jgi:hypothetical protein
MLLLLKGKARTPPLSVITPAVASLNFLFLG